MHSGVDLAKEIGFSSSQIRITHVTSIEWKMFDIFYKSGTAELSFVSFIRDEAFICIATSQSPSLLRNLTTAYNLGMCLLALPMIYVQNSILEVALNGYNNMRTALV